MSERLAILGASGLVGSALLTAARSRGLEVVGVARRPRAGVDEVADIADPDELRRLIDKVKPTRIALASAYAHVDGCEKDPQRSLRENVGPVKTLVESAAAPLLFFSSDHVFDGQRAVYRESDPVSPLSVYARHKVEAEGLLLAHPGSLIARTSYVFGPEPEPPGKNFMYQVVEAIRAGRTLQLPRAQAGTPTYSLWLAEAALELWLSGGAGIFHLVGPRVLTKAEWAREIAWGLDLPPPLLDEVNWSESGQVAPRPQRVVLSSERHQLTSPPPAAILRAHRNDWLAPTRS